MMRAAVVLLQLIVTAALELAACELLAPPPPLPRPRPPYSACLPKPPPLPAVATVEQLRARHDRIDTLYADCASRLRQNLDATK